MPKTLGNYGHFKVAERWNIFPPHFKGGRSKNTQAIGWLTLQNDMLQLHLRVGRNGLYKTNDVKKYVPRKRSKKIAANVAKDIRMLMEKQGLVIRRNQNYNG